MKNMKLVKQLHKTLTHLHGATHIYIDPHIYTHSSKYEQPLSYIYPDLHMCTTIGKYLHIPWMFTHN